ncbi:MAG: hypothetical protein R6X33_00160 [Candidatus Brocadiia bacterium]
MTDEALDRQAALKRREEMIEQERRQHKAALREADRKRTEEALRQAERIFITETQILLTRAYVRRLLGRMPGGEWGAFERGGYDYPVCSARELVRFCNNGGMGVDQMGRFSMQRVLRIEDLNGGPGRVLGYAPEDLLRQGVFEPIKSLAAIGSWFNRSRQEMHRRHASGAFRQGGAAKQHHLVMPHVWACEDGDPTKPPVERIERAIPFEALVDHKQGEVRILAIRSLKQDPEALAEIEGGPGAAAPFRLVRDRSGLWFETLDGAEQTAVRMEDLAGFEVVVDPKARRVLEVKALELEPEPEPEDEDSDE